MQAIILAAGKGTRLHPLTLETPKPMIPVNGKPMLQIILEQLKTAGVTDVVLVVHYLKDKIIDYFKDGSQIGLKITYVDQKEMRGSADAIAKCEPYVTDDKFFVIACDSLFETDQLSRVLAHKDADGVFTCKEVTYEAAKQLGVLFVEGNRVTKIIEKPQDPPSVLANFSVYLLPKAVFKACKEVPQGPKGEYWLPEAIQMLIDEGKSFEYEVSKHILDIGNHDQLAEAQELAKKLNL